MLQRLDHSLIEAFEFWFPLPVRIVLVVMQVAPEPKRIVGSQLLCDGSVNLGAVDSGLPMVDHHQEMTTHRRRGIKRNARAFQKVSNLHQLLFIRQIFPAGPVQDQHLPVAGDFQFAIMLLNSSGVFHSAQHGPHLSPLQVMWHGMLKDVLVNFSDEVRTVAFPFEYSVVDE